MTTQAELPAQAEPQPYPALSAASVQRTAALWVLCGRALGLAEFTAEDGPLPVDEPSLLGLAAELLELSDQAARALEVLACTQLAPSCAVLGQRVAQALGRDEALRIDVLDLAFASADLGAGLASAMLGDGGELRLTGAAVAKGESCRVGRVLLRFLVGGAASSPLEPFYVPRWLPESAAETAGRAGWADVLERLLAGGRPVLVSGMAGLGADGLAATVAGRRGVPLRQVDLAAVFDAATGLPTELMAQLHAQARLEAAIWLVVGLDRAAAAMSEKPLAVVRLADRLTALRRPLALVHEGPMPAELAQKLAVTAGLPHLEVAPLDLAERTEQWSTALQAVGFAPEPSQEHAAEIAHLGMGPTQIAVAAAHVAQQAQARQATALARGIALPAFVPTRSELRTAATTAMTAGLRRYGSRVDTTSTWADLVLPDEVLSQIKDLSRFARLRKKLFDDLGFGDGPGYGRALSAMFSGPSGTGKTMVAGLIAKEIGVELYRVDLSRVVSKYIGETEERLGQLFAEATQVGAALLFDEADSMFGARTEIRSSNDRYANLEVNYLLQRLEEFDGVIILTTNFAASIDEAFVRRLRFRVQFPFPGPEERAKLWEAVLPAKLPTEDDLDFEWLGEAFELSGGHIRNAMLRAGMLAADASGTLTMRMLYDAAAVEYRELGKLPVAYPFSDDW